MSDADVLLLEALGGGVWRVALNRPRAANAIDGALARAMQAAVRTTEDRDDVLVVILASSQPGVFCAGADLHTIAAGQVRDLFPERYGFGGLCLAERRKPWIAMVDGPAVAGGLELALACEMIVCSNRASFALPEVTRGLAALAGGVERLPARVGPTVAFDMLLTGEPIDALRAYQLGLVTRLCEPDVLHSLALRVASSIAANAPGAVRHSLEGARRAVLSGEASAWQTAPELERLRLESAEMREGVAAFLAKRRPSWSNC